MHRKDEIVRHYVAILALIIILVFAISILPDQRETGFAIPPPPVLPPPPDQGCNAPPNQPQCAYGNAQPQYDDNNCVIGYVCPQPPCIVVDRDTTLNSNQNGKCYEIRSGVTFDGGKYILAGNSSIGIKADNAVGFTIRNVKLRGYNTGIRVENSSSFLIASNDVNASGSGSVVDPKAGIKLYKSSSGTITANAIETNGVRIYGILASDSQSTLSSNVITTKGEDSHGISVVGRGSNVERNYVKAEQKGSHGIKISGASQSVVSRNFILTLSSNSPALVIDQSSSVSISRNEANTSGSSSPAIRIALSSSYTETDDKANSKGSFSDGVSIISSNGIIQGGVFSSSGFKSDGIALSNSDIDITGATITAAENALNLVGSKALANTIEARSPLFAIYADSASELNASSFVTGNSLVDLQGKSFALKDASSPQPPLGYVALDSVEAVSTGTFSKLLLHIRYPESALAGLSEESIKIWKYSSGQWLQSGFYTTAGIDVNLNKVSADINNFSSVFAALAAVKQAQCPAPPGQPQCTGPLLPVYDSNGCVKSYECVSCSVSSKRGDVNSDGRITSGDKDIALQIVSGLMNTPENICCIDISPHEGDGIVNVNDVGAIEKIISENATAGTCSNPADPEIANVVSCFSGSLRGDVNNDDDVTEEDVQLAKDVIAGRVPIDNLCGIDLYPLPSGDAVATDEDSYIISLISNGSIGSAGTCANPKDPRVQEGCSLPGPWSECAQAGDNWKRNRLEYVGESCKQTVVEEVCCPSDCGEDGQWSVCQSSIQSRFVYRCGAETSFACIQQAETRECATFADASALISQLERLIREALASGEDATAAQRKLEEAQKALIEGDYQSAAAAAKEGSQSISSKVQPQSDSTIVLAVLAAAVAVVLVGILTAFRKRSGMMKKEESPANLCAVCREYTTSGLKCAKCGGHVCLRHAVKRGGKVYCTNHAG
ncbi:MAG: hypothetical protein HYW25_03420 [Candidatus Aenigmarchaeota archaeon]|nr:hypothetical protein [Candidatus Aenigmarchaeota archaeon]